MENELDIDEIRDMETKEIQRTLNDLQKKKMQATADSKPGLGEPQTPARLMRNVKKSIAKCKTVMNERGRQNA